MPVPRAERKQSPPRQLKRQPVLNNNAARAASIIDNVAEAIIVIDQAQRVMMFNRAAEQMFGYRAAEILNQPLDLLLPTDVVEIHRQHIRDFNQAGLTVRPMEKRTDTRCRRKDGSEFLGQIGISKITEAGATLFTAVVTDITERKRAEETLQENELRLRRITDNMQDVIGQINVRGIFEYVSPSVQKVLGYKPEDLIGHSMFEHLHPDDRRTAIEVSWRTRQTKVIGRQEVRYQHAAGHPVWLEVEGIPLLDDQAQVIGGITRLRDITDRKHAEEMLQQLAAIVDSSHDAIISTDLSDKITSWNLAAERLYGYSAAEVQGRSILIIVPPERSNQISNYLVRLKRGETIDPYEAIRVRKDGRPVEVWVALSPIKNSTGQIVGVSSVARDITERKMAERALRETDMRMRLMTDNMLDVIGQIDVRGNYEYISPSVKKVLGYEQAEIIGHSMFRHLHPDDRQPAFAVSRQALRSRSVGRMELRYRHANGQYIWLEVAGVPRYAEQSRLIGAVVSMRDITTRKQAMGALRESEERYRTLAEAAQDLIFIIDRDSRIQYINESAAQELHLSKDNIIGQSADALFPPDGFDQQRSNLQKVFETGQPLYAQSQMIFPDRKIWLGTWLAPIRNETGAVTSVLGISRDISERKQAEQALASSASSYRGLFNGVGEAIYVQDREGRFLDVNSAAERMYGYSRETLIGQTPVFVSAPGKNDFDKVGEMVERAFAGEPQRFEFWGKRANGEVFPKEVRLIRGTYFGQDVVIASADDITERKQAERELRRHAEEFEQLYETARDLATQRDLPILLETIVTRAKLLLNAPSGFIYLYDPGRNEVEMTISSGLTTPVGTRLQLGQGMAGRVAASQQPLVVADYQVWPGRPAELAKFDFRAVLEVPMLFSGELIGVLGVNENGESTRQYTDADMRLLALFASQAASAVHNARLFAETHLRAQQQAALYHLSTILAQKRSIQELCEAVAHAAKEILHYPLMGVLLIEPATGDRVLQAQSGWQDIPMNLRLRPGQGVSEQAVVTGQLYYSPDTSREPRYVPGLRVPSSELDVPIKTGESVLGVLVVEKDQVDAFGPEDFSILQAVANQLAVALENAQLFEVERNQRRRLEILYWSGQAINSTVDVNAILARLTDEAMRATQATYGSVLIARPDLGYFERRSMRGYSSELIEKVQTDRVPLSSGVNGRAYQAGQVIYVGDVRQDPTCVVLTPDTRSELVVPILHGDKVIGNLDLQSTELDAFRDIDLGLLEALTDQVAIAIDKANLFEEVQQYAVELEERVTQRTLELTAANTRLQELDQLKDKFVSNVSHELRTPFTVIRLSLDLLDHGKPEKRAEYLQSMRREVNRLDKMIGDLLDLSRLDRRAVRIDLVPTDVNQVAGWLMTDRLILAAEHGLTAKYQPDVSLPAVLADVNLLTQVISNLLTNAINYTPSGGIVTLTTGLTKVGTEDWVIVTVKDTGPGIPAEDLPHLFDRFYRGQSSRESTAPGTGLGLAICKEILEQLGGRITVESQPGQGAAFTVWLPPIVAAYS
jgi:PAS domain S-box-containing protein